MNSIAALGAILKVCADEQLPWFITGKGSNLLVSDEGYDGVVITLAGDFRAWRFDDEVQHVVVGTGTMLSRLVQEVFHHGYSGMEFAVGTPGTVGGALVQKCGHPKRLDGFSRGVCYGIQCTNGTKTLRCKRLDVGVSHLFVFTKRSAC